MPDLCALSDAGAAERILNALGSRLAGGRQLPGRPDGVAVAVPAEIEDKRIGCIDETFVPAVQGRPPLPDVIVARDLAD